MPAFPRSKRIIPNGWWDLPGDEQLYWACSIFIRAKLLVCKDSGGDCTLLKDGCSWRKGVCISPMPSDSGMAKQSHGVLQNVPQSSMNYQQHFTPALENGFLGKFGWFLQQTSSLRGALELSEGLWSIPSASPCISSMGRASDCCSMHA